jgi:predicted dehydrogenase
MLRIGVVGLGNIGARHVLTLLGGAAPAMTLTAVASRSGVPDTLKLPDSVVWFPDCQSLVDSGLVDAVLIASPSHAHGAMGAAVLSADLHLLMEKPLGVSVAEARQLVAMKKPGQVFAVMLNQRFDPAYARMRALIAAGAIGSLRRVNWTMTQWYRPDVYFRVSAWRGTWPGEGGGVLLNQCIHNLDILQWLTGMPSRVRAFAGFGRHHHIDVEDEVTAYLEFGDEATGVVVASTGEAPGINQLDVVGDRGTLRFDGRQITKQLSGQSVAEHCRETLELFGMPAFSSELEVFDTPVDQHAELLRNFAAAVIDSEALLTPAEEGLKSLELANAMLLSSWVDETVDLPLDAERHSRELVKRVRSSGFRTPEALEVETDIEKSFR